MNESVEELIGEICGCRPHTLADYEREHPRWCKGCGDYSVLTSLQRALKNHDTPPEQVVVVSGIGCSSRLPHYVKTYGFHTIHGRALPIATGVRLARPDLHVIVTIGDGDCFSIGGNHWLHAIRYNVRALVLVLDNEVYALTKNQVSPTTPQGRVTNTSPKGAILKPLNPLSVMAGITNLSFLAQTATWFPAHLDATIERAWDHRGLAFVRILQRCPVYMPDLFGESGKEFPAVFLEDDQGIPVDSAMRRWAGTLAHDSSDLARAFEVARVEKPAPMGLLYHNEEIPAYDRLCQDRLDHPDRDTFLQRLNARMDEYAVG